MAYAGQTREPGERRADPFRQTAAETGGGWWRSTSSFHRTVGSRAGYLHPLQEERFQVVEGTMRFRMGRQRVVAGPGEVVVVPRGVKHDFANAADDEALVRVEVRPALKMERLFETAVELARQGRTMFGGIPKPLDLALFVGEFKDEVRGLSPFWLQRLVLAPLAPLARRRGCAQQAPALAPARCLPAAINS